MKIFHCYSTEMICKVGATMHRQLVACFCSNLTSPPRMKWRVNLMCILKIVWLKKSLPDSMSVTSNGDLTLILDLRRVFIMLQIQTRFRVRRRNNLKGKNFPLKLKKQFWKKFLYFKASRRCIWMEPGMAAQFKKPWMERCRDGILVLYFQTYKN